MCVRSSLSTSSSYCRIVLIHRCSLLNVCFIGYYVIGTILVVLSALITIYHDQIVDWLKPAANWMKEYVDIHSCASIVCKLMAAHSLPAGWLIPIAILFVISFPPVSLSFCFVRETCDIRAGSHLYTLGVLRPIPIDWDSASSLMSLALHIVRSENARTVCIAVAPQLWRPQPVTTSRPRSTWTVVVFWFCDS